MMRNNHDDDDDVFSRLTYKASGQNPVLDYMISVDELPERYLLPLLAFLCFELDDNIFLNCLVCM